MNGEESASKSSSAFRSFVGKYFDLTRMIAPLVPTD